MNYYLVIDQARALGAGVSVELRRRPGRRQTLCFVRIYTVGDGWRKLFWIAHGGGSWKVGLMSARTYEFASAESVLPFIRECASPRWRFFSSSLPPELMKIAGLRQVDWQPCDTEPPRPPRQFRKKVPK